jgi:hypothetical protein
LTTAAATRGDASPIAAEQRRAARLATPTLRITSPANGAVVRPGQTITVRVDASAGARFASVFVIGMEPIGSSGPIQSFPATVTLKIPESIECRTYGITAFGITTGGQEVIAPIQIDVERPDMPARLSSELREINFQAEAESHPIDLMAHFADGKMLSVRNSSKVTYRSANPEVATVDALGMVTAVAEGETQIVATYGPAARGRSLRVPVSVPAPRFVLVPKALDFRNRPVGSSSNERMTLTNSSEREIRIVSIESRGDFSAASNCMNALPLAPGASCDITVTFKPTGVGLREGTLRVDSDFHIFPVPFKLAGTGTRP